MLQGNLKSFAVAKKNWILTSRNATSLSDWQINPPLVGIWLTSIYLTNWLVDRRTRSVFGVQSREPFANVKIVNSRKGSPQSSKANLLPPPLHLLASVFSILLPLLVLIRLLAKQSLVIFVSPAVSKVIGGPSAVVTLNQDLQVPARRILVSPQTLEVNESFPKNLAFKLSIHISCYNGSFQFRIFKRD